MSESSKSDEELFDPRIGLRKSLCSKRFPCNESVITASSSSARFERSLKKKSKLSLSQRSPKTEILFCGNHEPSMGTLETSNPTGLKCQSALNCQTYQDEACFLQQPSTKRSKIEKIVDHRHLSSNDPGFSSHAVDNSKTADRDQITESKKLPVSFTPWINRILPSSECFNESHSTNSNQDHFRLSKKVESNGTRKTIRSSVISLDISKNTVGDINLNHEDFPSQEMTSFATGESKEDFVKQWIESCGTRSTFNIDDDDDETQPLPTEEKETDPLFDEIPAPSLIDVAPVIDNGQQNFESNSISSPLKITTNSPRSSSLRSRGMVTPVKNDHPRVVPSSSSGKQTTITAFFTPRTKSSEKRIDTTDPLDDKRQNHLAIKELNNELEMTMDPNAASLVEYTVDDEAVNSSIRSDVKQQWSFIMSRMQMRGTSSNLQREIKRNEKPKASKEPKPTINSNPKLEPGTNSERKCPFYKLIPGTGFAIDAFCYGRVKGVTSYFLSHFHYDHYRGLGKWLDKPLYCSQVTANLVNLKIKPNPSLVRVLPLHESRLIENVEVILIDANHCPGSVMFLFRFITGRIVLHVGDFRAHPSMENLKELNGCQIDHLYLDTTYLDEHYALPPQEEVLAYVSRLVRLYVKRYQKLLVVSGTYTIGKEKVFMAAAEELNCKIWAPTEKRRIFNCLEDGSIMSRLAKDPFEARVHVVNMGDIKPANLKSYLDRLKGSFSHILALNPTGWEYDGRMALKGLDSIQPKVYYGTIYIHGVPYSEHSGFTEMERFVRHFQPRKIIPTVNVGSATQRQKMETVFTKWLGYKSF